MFRAEVSMLGSGRIYIRSEEGKAEGVGQSEMRNEGGKGHLKSHLLYIVFLQGSV
jgi:hypothetical protein